MYPSDHHHQQQRGRLPPSNLARYGSAPGSLLTSMVDSVMSDGDFSSSVVGSDDTTNTNTPTHSTSRYFPDSSCKVNLHPDLNERAAAANNANGFLQRSSSSSSSSFAINQSNQISLGPGPGHGPSPAQLIRHSSSPAGFFSHLVVDNNEFMEWSAQFGIAIKAKFVKESAIMNAELAALRATFCDKDVDQQPTSIDHNTLKLHQVDRQQPTVLVGQQSPVLVDRRPQQLIDTTSITRPSSRSNRLNSSAAHLRRLHIPIDYLHRLIDRPS